MRISCWNIVEMENQIHTVNWRKSRLGILFVYFWAFTAAKQKSCLICTTQVSHFFVISWQFEMIAFLSHTKSQFAALLITRWCRRSRGSVMYAVTIGSYSGFLCYKPGHTSVGCQLRSHLFQLTFHSARRPRHDSIALNKYFYLLS